MNAMMYNYKKIKTLLEHFEEVSSVLVILWPQCYRERSFSLKRIHRNTKLSLVSLCSFSYASFLGQQLF